MNLKPIKNIILVVALALVSGLVGYKLGTNQVTASWKNFRPNVEVVNKLPSNKPVDFSLFWSVWDEVSQKFVDKSKLDSQKMVYGAITGMVQSLGDPYTVFLPPTQNKAVKEDLNGSFEGIGAQLGIKDNRIIVISPLPDSPAKRAGIKTGDFVLKVDGAETANWSLPEAVAKIRGPKGTTVTLNILHPGEAKAKDVAIVRDTIVLKSVSWHLVSSTASANLKPATYIQLSRFGDATDPQWDATVSDLSNYLATSSGTVSGVILDLRNNPGGYLAGAVYIASEFLPDGVVVKQQDYQGQTQIYSVERRGKLLTVPLVVLVNGGTASASEILAGALQVRSRAKVVGVQSFGKGSVQTSEDLPSGAGLHVTVAKWLLANDVWINGTGLTPDIKIDNDEKDPTRDLQVEKAVETLNSK
ncbi:S41 family peptidase [Candidatus Microgenomates bacterium]|nr:S41 family peptidase [Candidatus Microgenomates bacterium]